LLDQAKSAVINLGSATKNGSRKLRQQVKITYTYSEARQKLAIVLEQAEDTGKVLIRRKDGRTFALTPEKTISSPSICSIN
jgi:hypothetical protein